MVSLLFFQNLFSLHFANKYTLFFQQREEKSAMLEEAAFTSGVSHSSSTRKIPQKGDRTHQETAVSMKEDQI
jgi:hypothetical protein